MIIIIVISMIEALDIDNIKSMNWATLQDDVWKWLDWDIAQGQ